MPPTAHVSKVQFFANSIFLKTAAEIILKKCPQNI